MSPRANPTPQYRKKARAWFYSEPVRAAFEAHLNELARVQNWAGYGDLASAMNQFEHSTRTDPLVDDLILWAVQHFPPHLQPPGYKPTLPRGMKKSDFIDPLAYRRPRDITDVPLEAFSALFPFGAQEYLRGNATLYCDDAEAVRTRIEMLVQAQRPYRVTALYISTRAPSDLRRLARDTQFQTHVEELASRLALGVRQENELYLRSSVMLSINDTVWMNDWDPAPPTFVKLTAFPFLAPRPADRKLLLAQPFVAFSLASYEHRRQRSPSFMLAAFPVAGDFVTMTVKVQ